MRAIQIITISFLLSTISFGQNEEPIWNIGTKWTYEFLPDESTTTFVVNEIVDTVTIDNLKLYEVESYPYYTGIQYFHYRDDKVYNYNPNNQVLQLLYDFENIDKYNINYRPICDPFFDESSPGPFDFKNYTILVDSLDDFQMPDGSVRSVQYVSTVDTVFEGSDTSFIKESNREILSHIGFNEGYIHNTHDWELGMYICDEFANFATKLRCFENDSIQYNFNDYPCDTTWMLTNTNDLELAQEINVYPNPANGTIQIYKLGNDSEYEVFDLNGIKLESGKTIGSEIELQHSGVNILRIKQNDDWIYFRVINYGEGK